VETVSIADVDYKLFMQPCCAPTVRGEKPLVMIGLVASSVIRSHSWAISTTVVKLAVMGMLLVLIGWPFLKLWLIGDRQQVRVGDLFQLGASSVAGLAVVTIVLLDVTAYWQLNRHRDAHLQRLAEALDAHTTREIGAAHRQLDCIEQQMAHFSPQQGATFHSVLRQPKYGCSPAAQEGGTRRNQPPPTGAWDSESSARWEYPFFETFSLIDEQGVQRIKLATTDWVPSTLDVSQRPYFQNAAAGRGWTHPTMCPGERCTFESIWSWTTGEPEAILSRRSSTQFKVASIAFPVRSLIRPVLPPGFEFAVIDRTGRVLFHSDRRRNVSENFFEETDDNRRLRAQVAAHSEEPLNLRYWGAAYRAYVKPMALPDTYVVAMYQKQRAWAINREWLVVTLVFLTGYLLLWLVLAMVTLLPEASWVWPDPARRTRYHAVTALHSVVILLALLGAWSGDRNALLWRAFLLPVIGWAGTFFLLRRRPRAAATTSREPVVPYSVAAVLLLVVCGVLPGALLFAASFQIHMHSYVKNSQLVIANGLSARLERLMNEYTGGREPAQRFIHRLSDDDLYYRFLYDTCIRDSEETSCPGTPLDERMAALRQAAQPQVHAGSATRDGDTHEEDTVLSLLEDYLPYYSEASVEWRELLHDHADDGSWDSETTSDGRLILALRGEAGHGPLVASAVPSLVGPVASSSGSSVTLLRPERPGQGEPSAVGTSGRATTGEPAAAGQRGSGAGVLLLLSAIAIIALTWSIVYTLMRRVFLIGVTEPLWVTAGLAANAGDNIFVRRDEKTRGQQINGTLPLQLGPIVRQSPLPRKTPRQRDEEVQRMWRKALIDLDRQDRMGAAVLVEDFDEDLEDAAVMERKLTLLEELVGDPSRTVVLVSRLSPTGLGDSLRSSGGGGAAGSPADRWRRLVGAFTVVDWRGREEDAAPAGSSLEVQEGTRAIPPGAPEPDAAPAPHLPAAPAWNPSRLRFGTMRAAAVSELLSTEGQSHPFVKRVCSDLQASDAVTSGQLTREQALDEIGERAAQCYRRIWESCSADQKVVLGHIAQHGLANASARTTVRRLLGRRLLHKDPALRPMNETFRRFILSGSCRADVARLEASAAPSAWDRLRMPLAIGVVGVGVFLFSTQRELYNAILGVTTAAAVSVPALIRTVTMLAGRRGAEGESVRA
jgi:hypothetical protein